MAIEYTTVYAAVILPDKPQPAKAILKTRIIERLEDLTGYKAKGNFGHAGRPGLRGGSAPNHGLKWNQPVDPITGRPIPIKVSSVEAAIPLILDGKVVEVATPEQASTIITRLAEIANDAKAKGKEAPNYDLCQISVSGSNLFCSAQLRNERYPRGVPRVEMPQLGGTPVPGSLADGLPRNPRDGEVDGSTQFLNHVQNELGIKVTTTQIPAAHLKASQAELVGPKVAAMMLDPSYDPSEKHIFMSNDNYVVDGHHRWAATVGRDAADNNLGDLTMNVHRIDAPITEVLHIANKWSKEFGIKQKAAIKSMKGGQGSGYFAHAGRPGQRGGSSSDHVHTGKYSHDDISQIAQAIHERLSTTPAPNEMSNDFVKQHVLQGMLDESANESELKVSKTPTGWKWNYGDDQGTVKLDPAGQFFTINSSSQPTKQIPVLTEGEAYDRVLRYKSIDEITDFFKGNENSGNYNHAGRPGLVGGSAPSKIFANESFQQAGGVIPGHKERFLELKAQYDEINHELLKYVDTPEDPKALALMNALKENMKEQVTLKCDPGGLEGIGLPGGTRDVVIIGAGPGGMQAATMAKSDGLDTLLVDANDVPGGQSRYSSRVENLAGFPIGVSGNRLASNMYDQVQRVGADTKLGVKVTSLEYNPETGIKTLTLSNGDKVAARSVIIAGGVQFNQMTFEGANSSSVLYGDGKRLAEMGIDQPVVVVGGSNGAAQAALGAAHNSSSVTVLSRSPLEKAMSASQVSALRNNPKIRVIEGDEIAKLELNSNGSVKTLVTRKGESIPTHAVGVFIGSKPNTSWLPSSVKLSGDKIQTDADLQTTLPGVYAVGDIRTGSIGRIVTAMGDGALAARNVWTYFNDLREKEKKGGKP